MNGNFINTCIIALLLTTSTASATHLSMDSKKEKYCLAQNIYFEARNQIVKGQLAVGFVVMNRLKSDKHPNTICDVVWERKQFSWTHDGRSDKPKNILSWKIANLVADAVLTFPGNDNTGKATFYHANYVNPKWSKTFVKTAVIGDHLFYKEK